MEPYGNEWTRKGATLSDKTARAEFGLTQDEIIAAIRAGKLQYRRAEIEGNPWLRLLRREADNRTHVRRPIDPERTASQRTYEIPLGRLFSVAPGIPTTDLARTVEHYQRLVFTFSAPGSATPPAEASFAIGERDGVSLH